MSTFRKERMSEAIRKVVTEKLMREQSIIPAALVTINRVDVTKDFGMAKIFYSVFGNNVDERSASALMKEHQAEFRYEISQKLNLRRTPKVEFCFDKNTEHAFKIDALLRDEGKI
jgi:ribosome-binding factor A